MGPKVLESWRVESVARVSATCNFGVFIAPVVIESMTKHLFEDCVIAARLDGVLDNVSGRHFASWRIGLSVAFHGLRRNVSSVKTLVSALCCLFSARLTPFLCSSSLALVRSLWDIARSGRATALAAANWRKPSRNPCISSQEDRLARSWCLGS